jgi:hypothetical protein|tara:strand:+ start:1289 stop:1546 length:258 start_codon:yes stop_codon:yes gene_type:complete
MFGMKKDSNWEKWDKEVSDELYVLLKEEIRTTLDKETTDWIDDHSNRKMKIFIHGNVDRRYKTYAQNLLDARKESRFDDTVCKYQ